MRIIAGGSNGTDRPPRPEPWRGRAISLETVRLQRETATTLDEAVRRVRELRDRVGAISEGLRARRHVPEEL